MEKESKKNIYIILGIIILIIIGILLYFYFVEKGLSLRSNDLMYADGENTITIEAKSNYTYHYRVSDDTIADFANEELTGKKVTNNLVVKSSGNVTVFVQVYDKDKLIKTIEKNIKTCGNIVNDYSLKKEYHLKVGEELTIFPNDDECTKNLSIQIIDESIVSSIENNRLFGIKPGSTTITISHNGFAFQANVIVGAKDGKYIPVTGISIKEQDITLGIGEQYNLKASIKPNNATNKKIKYSSSDEEIVKVLENGKIEGLKEGESIITLVTEDGNYTVNVNVSVSEKKKSIKLNLSNATIREGEKVVLKATTIPGNLSISWESSNSEIASVSSGTVIGKKKGEATIYAKLDDQIFATCEIKVLDKVIANIPVEKLTITPSNARINVGYEMPLKLDITPGNATNKSVTWSSSNPSVVSVTNGHIKALSGGTATITAQSADGNKTATALITVIGSSIITPTPSSVVRVNSISLAPANYSLLVGQTGTITAVISPSNATNKGVTWVSSNTSVATVANGVVTAKGVGTAMITATTIDGSKKATTTVTVLNNSTTISVTGVTVSPTTLNLRIGETRTVTATVSPSNATNKNITWASTTPSVATVSNGIVKALSAGNAMVYVTTSDGNKHAFVNVNVTGDSGSISSGNERLHSINTGQAANAILLESSGRFGLVDAGGNCSRITSYLSSVGVRNLDFIIVSHMHYDHAQCVTSVMSSFPTSKVILKKYNGYDKGNNWSYYNSIVGAAGSKVEYFSGSSSKSVTLGNMTLKLFNGQERLSSVQGQYSENSNSIVVGVTSKVGSKTMLTYLAGDIQDSNTGVEGSVASTVASSYSGKKFDVYVASHHGYRSCNTTSAIGSGSSKIQFKNAIVTNTFEWMCGTYCGKDNGCPYDGPKATGVYNIYKNLARNGGSTQIRFSGASTVVVNYTSSGVSLSGGQVLNCNSSSCGSAEKVYSTIKSNSSVCSRVTR